MKRGKLFIIIAPSGTGKSTLIARLKNDYPQLKWSVSYTTRAPRKGEIHGLDYFFTDKVEFQKMIERELFTEWATVHGNFYGTSKSFVHEGLSRGDNLLFDLDVQGADRVLKDFRQDSISIFIAPPSIDELEKRLRGRGTDDTQVINTRLRNAESELQKKHTYDHLVFNEDLEVCYQNLKKIFAEILG
jgi:guanylate kinase